MRNGLLAVLLCAAVGASAAGSWTRSWTLNGDGEGAFAKVTMYEAEDGVRLKTHHESRFQPVKLTRDEAASLGRALLEAAGQPEKTCVQAPTVLPHNGILTLTPGGQSDGRNCRLAPCPEGRVGCAVLHWDCNEEKK